MARRTFWRRLIVRMRMFWDRCERTSSKVWDYEQEITIWDTQRSKTNMKNIND